MAEKNCSFDLKQQSLTHSFVFYRDESARMSYQVISTDTDKPIITVNGGVISSGAICGQAHLQITAYEEFGTNQTIVLLIKVTHKPNYQWLSKKIILYLLKLFFLQWEQSHEKGYTIYLVNWNFTSLNFLVFRWGWVWHLMPLSTIFSYIVAVSFIGGGNHRSAASHWPWSHNVVSSTPRHEWGSNDE